MKKECTEQDLRELARSAQAVFEAVTLTEAPRCDGWQDDGLRVDYELRNGCVDCVLHRRVEADGKCWELEMCAPLAGNVLPEERMTPRETRDDMTARATIDRLMEMCRAITLTGQSWRSR